jgi:hypothetical protein
MVKRLFLLLLCAPLLWVAAYQGWYLVRQALAAATAPPEEKLRKDLEEMTGEYKAKWAARPENFAPVVALSEKKRRDEELSETERNLAEAVDEHARKARDMRTAALVLAGHGDKLPKALLEWKPFPEWGEHRQRYKGIKDGITELCAALKAGIGAPAADELARQIKGLEEENKGLSRRFFAESAGQNQKFLAACAQLTPLLTIPKPAAADVKSLDQLVARSKEHYPGLFADVAKTLAEAWLEGMMKPAFAYDDKAWIYDDPKWAPAERGRITVLPENVRLDNPKYVELQFEKRRWKVDEAGKFEADERCPTSKSLLAFFYNQARKKAPLSAERVERFTAYMEKEHAAQLKQYEARQLAPRGPVERDWEAYKGVYAEIWEEVERMRQLVRAHPGLFGVR